MESSRSPKFVSAVLVVALGLTVSSSLWAAPEPECIEGHHTVVAPCAFPNAALSLDAATGPNGDDVFLESGGGHHGIVTFPIDPNLGPGIQLRADIEGAHPPYRAADDPNGVYIGSITQLSISTLSHLPLIKGLSFELLNPVVTGTGSISWSFASLAGDQTKPFDDIVFANPVNSITGALTVSLIAGPNGNASVDGFVLNLALAPVPEPSSLAFLGAGLGFFLLLFGRKHFNRAGLTRSGLT